MRRQIIETDSPLERLVQAVRESAKYRSVSVEMIRNVGTTELAIRRSWKEAVKETKNKLHQVAGAYLDGRFPYEDWQEMLTAAAPAGDLQPLRNVCVQIMERHASTRERLAGMDTFYNTLFAELPPIHSVLDLACGLNPLAIPWMPLAPGARYIACDLFEDMMAFLNVFFHVAGIAGEAFAWDVTSALPERTADLALILKALPPLEQVDKTAPLRLLRAVKADYMLVSFPTRSLGGHGKGMAENYEVRFLRLIGEEGWEVRRFLFPNELCFLVRKG